MYGSLSEFIDVKQKFKLQQIPNRGSSMQLQVTSFSQYKKEKYKNLLAYQTLDKSIYLKSKVNKQKQRQLQRQMRLREAVKSEPKPKKSSDHWVEKTFDKSNLKPKHKLLRAVILTKQLQSQDNYNTIYDKSLGRIISAYSKIKTQPIDSLLPPKMIEVDNELPKQQQVVEGSRSSSIDAGKLLSLENSVRWAKKHGKEVKSFYEQMGKSFELIDKQKPGKSNYKLQRQMRDVEDEQKRRGVRRKFLKQIQRRIAKYSVSGSQRI